MTRALIPIADLPAYEALGWLLVFVMAGGWRIEGPAAVIAWAGTGRAVWE